MSLDALRESLPPYAKDIATNLDKLTAETVLSDQQKWGCFVASAHAVGEPHVVKAIERAAAEAGLSEAAKTAAKAASAIMSMNNIYYRAIHIMQNPEYQTMPAHLRMTTISQPGVERADFELWSLAVSAVNGCGACLDAHESELRKMAVSSTVIQASLRIAAVVNAASRVMAGEAAAA
jgi:alkyl hydroperoxide reductase subunit D